MISAIILTWNSEKYIKKCLDSLQKSTETAKKDLEVFVIDNGSKDKTLEIIENIQQKKPFINLIKLETNRGTTYSRNLGIKKAKGEYVLILDSDLELKKDTLEKLLNRIKNDSEIGIICPKLIYPDGQLQNSFKKFPTIKVKILKILSVKFDYFKKLADKDELYEKKTEEFFPDYCISACWLMPKKIFKKIGLFDEKIFYAPEDVDFCLRVWLAEFKILYYPQAEAVHYEQRLSYKNKKIAFNHIQGLFYFFKKHKYWFSRKNIYKKIINKD